MHNLRYAAVLGGLILLFAPAALAAEHSISMVSAGAKGTFYFEPRRLFIKSGDTVTWVNIQDDTHNVMAESIPKTAEKFESPALEKKGHKWSYQFTRAGTYRYHCHPHAENGMVGTIIVDRPSKTDEIIEINHHSSHTHH